MSQNPITNPLPALSLSIDPSAGQLQRGPLNPQQQLEALRRVQVQAEKRVQLGQRLFRAAEASATQHHTAMAQLRQDQDLLRKQLQDDLSRTVQGYDQWIGRIDTDLAAAVTTMQQKIEQLQEQWSQAQVRLEAIAARSDALLMQATDLLAQTGDLLTQSINERTERPLSDVSLADDEVLDDEVSEAPSLEQAMEQATRQASQQAIAPELCEAPHWAINLHVHPLELTPPLLADESMRVNESISWLPTLLPAFGNETSAPLAPAAPPARAESVTDARVDEKADIANPPVTKTLARHEATSDPESEIEPLRDASIRHEHDNQVLEIEVIEDDAPAAPRAAVVVAPAAESSEVRATIEPIAAAPIALKPAPIVAPSDVAINALIDAATAIELAKHDEIAASIKHAPPVEPSTAATTVAPAIAESASPIVSAEPVASAEQVAVELTPLSEIPPVALTPLPMQLSEPEPPLSQPAARQPLRFDDPSVPRVARDPDLWVMLPMSPEDQIEEAPAEVARMLPSLHHPALCEHLPEGTDPVVEQVLSQVVSPEIPQANDRVTDRMTGPETGAIADDFSSLREAMKLALREEPKRTGATDPQATSQPGAMTPLSAIPPAPPAKPSDTLSSVADPEQMQSVNMPSDFYRKIVQRLREQVDHERGD
jgi:hypothetical protein